MLGPVGAIRSVCRSRSTVHGVRRKRNRHYLSRTSMRFANWKEGQVTVEVPVFPGCQSGGVLDLPHRGSVRHCINLPLVAMAAHGR
ncbi:hypothetical protein Rmet_6761 (plasmid) [Cupriavidus metallidurans CH34]|uniref:Uncharacterized protein n=1 Tax=Cupriavidus metallidurans (strain ATCC 43123 / DSM 2839 / NBRC 102507 / CH34) TaxID=266264 RepID=D3DYH0_CUPMC|nr:hypothetical protein Rmet_6761 [Cupriavidus metallidurans CH34]